MKNFKFEKVTDLPLLSYIYFLIKDLDNYYPNFKNWYFNKFIPSVLLQNDIALLMKNKYDEIVGVSLLKNKDEIKLRALRILPQFQNRGYGLYLIDESLKTLDHPLPHCTVAEELINNYARIFINRYGFTLDYVERNLYRKGKNEYLFNLQKF
jgi:ribosomal protein S18 acetylase RimI-like enzyme